MKNNPRVALEKAVDRIVNMNISDSAKAMKLWNLAAKQVPGSQAQAYVKEFWNTYWEKSHS